MEATETGKDMTDKRQLAEKIAAIVFDMVEQDRCLSNPRLTDRIHEVLLLAEPQPITLGGSAALGAIANKDARTLDRRMGAPQSSYYETWDQSDDRTYEHLVVATERFSTGDAVTLFNLEHITPTVRRASHHERVWGHAMEDLPLGTFCVLVNGKLRRHASP